MKLGSSILSSTNARYRISCQTKWPLFLWLLLSLSLSLLRRGGLSSYLLCLRFLSRVIIVGFPLLGFGRYFFGCHLNSICNLYCLNASDYCTCLSNTKSRILASSATFSLPNSLSLGTRALLLPNA